MDVSVNHHRATISIIGKQIVLLCPCIPYKDWVNNRRSVNNDNVSPSFSYTEQQNNNITPV